MIPETCSGFSHQQGFILQLPSVTFRPVTAKRRHLEPNSHLKRNRHEKYKRHSIRPDILFHIRADTAFFDTGTGVRRNGRAVIAVLPLRFRYGSDSCRRAGPEAQFQNKTCRTGKNFGAGYFLRIHLDGAYHVLSIHIQRCGNHYTLPLPYPCHGYNDSLFRRKSLAHADSSIRIVRKGCCWC